MSLADRGARGSASDLPRGKAARSGEPQEIGSVLDGLLGKRPWVAGVALGLLGRSWEAVVGERLAQETAPVALEAGVLLVRASSAAWGAQVRFLSRQVQTLANEVLGGEQIREVKVAVDAGPAAPSSV